MTTVQRALRRLSKPWQRHVVPSVQRALWACLLAGLLLGAHVARLGKVEARLSVVFGLCCVVAAVIVTRRRDRRDFGNAERTISRVLVPTDRAAGERTLRAAELSRKSVVEPSYGSATLAELHLERLLARVPFDRVARLARKRARRFRFVAVALLGAAAVSLLGAPWRVAEGLDVLVSTGAKAPVAMTWLERVRIASEPPNYLRSGARLLFTEVASTEAVGSLISVQGVPVREGRNLVLTDGEKEVPFVSDGEGGVVARYRLRENAKLIVAARFGDVLIQEPETLELKAITDASPVVVLEGAPKRFELEQLQQVDLLYHAQDDHGLKQIDLVLESGKAEDRRVLLRLGESERARSGGHRLRADDPFLERAFLPVRIWIEARDNDPVTGPKWGKSRSFVIFPPRVASAEAQRYRALLKARAELVGLLGAGASPEQPSAKPRRERLKHSLGTIRRLMTGIYGGLKVPAGIRTFVEGQAERLMAPVGREAYLERLEASALAMDAVLAGLSGRDVKRVAPKLGEVAEEVAAGAEQARQTEARAVGLERADVALQALSAGIQGLVQLGPLGRDLGSVAQGDLFRIKSSRDREDLMHTELSARHLAARLRRPRPSFGSAARGGVESGLSSGGRAPPKPTQSDEQFDRMSAELEQLALDHAMEITEVEKALKDAADPQDLEALREEAKRRAEQLRRSTEALPSVGVQPDTAPGMASLSREHARATAESMGQLELRQALESGREALGSLEDAKRLNDAEGGSSLDEEVLRAAGDELKKQLSWIEETLEKLERRVQERARKKLTDAAERERRLSERAGNLAGRGQRQETALPAELIDRLEQAEQLMHQAARELKQGSSHKALDQQREAQRLLERSNPGEMRDPTRPSESGPQASDEDGRHMSRHGEVPDAQKDNRADEFRKRVLEGLGKSSGGRLAPAIKRYAEQLLQ